MFDHLRGILDTKQPTRAVVSVSGVGYELAIPLSSFDALPGEGEPTVLYTHLRVREDALSLYGFATEEERRFFRRLLGVNGIGPAVALSILSSTRYGDFRDAVLEGDVAILTRLKGVGKKLAQRMVVELQEVLEKDAAALGTSASGSRRSALEDDAVSALVTLGFTKPQAAAAVKKVFDGAEPTDLGEVVREALRVAG